jgi:hypothetical protein
MREASRECPVARWLQWDKDLALLGACTGVVSKAPLVERNVSMAALCSCVNLSLCWPGTFPGTRANRDFNLLISRRREHAVRRRVLQVKRAGWGRRALASR